MIAGGCKHCGGTCGAATVPDPDHPGQYLQAHALCHFLALRGAPTPKLGDVCPCCNGSGCHPRSGAGPINPNQDAIERWAPACVTCKGNGAINIECQTSIANRDREAAKKLHWYEQCAPAVLELDLSQSTEVLQRAIRVTYTARRFPFMWWQLEADEQSGKVYSGGNARPGDNDRVIGVLVHKAGK